MADSLQYQRREGVALPAKEIRSADFATRGINMGAHEAGAIRWPYSVDYDKINRIETDVLIIGGGLAGCAAGIAAARRGMKVVVCDKAPIKRSGNGGAGIDHWNDITDGLGSTVTADEKYASGMGDNMNRGFLAARVPP